MGPFFVRRVRHEFYELVDATNDVSSTELL